MIIYLAGNSGTISAAAFPVPHFIPPVPHSGRYIFATAPAKTSENAGSAGLERGDPAKSPENAGTLTDVKHIILLVIRNTFCMYSDKRLGFLLEVLELREISKVELAARLQVSQQSVFKFLRNDNMKLSQAVHIMDVLGYKLVVYLERDGDDMRSIVRNADRMLKPEERKLLTFLKIAFRKYNIDAASLASLIGLYKTGVMRWFKVDDILISRLYQVAEAYDLKLCIFPELK